MAEAPFVYCRLRVPRGGLAELRKELAVRAAEHWALFAAQIGAFSDEAVLIGTGSDAPALTSATVLDVEPLRATVRPLGAEPLRDDAVYAHRWFTLALADWPEFLALSDGAWPGFEAANPGVHIEGFFRSEREPEEKARVLLVTRYPSLAAWEQSRNASDEAGGANFRRRHALTETTIVVTYRLLP